MSKFAMSLHLHHNFDCVRAMKALARMRVCTGSPEPSLLALAMSTKTLWSGLARQYLLLSLLKGTAKMRQVPIYTNWSTCLFSGLGLRPCLVQTSLLSSELRLARPLRNLTWNKHSTAKPVLSGHSKRRHKLVFKTDYRLMQVKSIWSNLQYFRPSLSYHLSLRPLFCLFWVAA